MPDAQTNAESNAPGAMSPAAVKAFIGALAKQHADAHIELDFRNPFELLVAVMLSAQTTDKSVNKVTPALFARAPDARSMAALGEEEIGRYIHTIGLWRAKARNLAGLCRMLVTQHGGEVPHDRESLEALPGVGRKTANVVLNEGFGESTMPVDTHVFRVSNRSGLAPGKNPREVEDALIARLPKETLRPAHNWLIFHGRYVCKARLPECWRCAGEKWCLYPNKILAPPPGKKAAGSKIL